MYPKNAASPEPIAIGAVVQISDGVVQTSGCTVRIKPIGVAEGDGAGTTAYSTDGIVLYTPTQGETNYTSFILIAKKTGCIPVSVTVVTTSSVTPGTVLLAPVTHTSAVVPTVSTLTGHTPQTGDTYALANGASGFVATKADTAAILVDTGTTLQAELDGIQADTEDIQTRLPAALTVDGNIKADALRVGGTLQTAGDIPALVATVDTVVDAIKTKTDQFVFTVANQVDANALSGGGGLDAAGVRSAIGLASANLDTQLADIPTVSEFNARTIPSADYFDPSVDTVAQVTLVSTTSTVTDGAKSATALSTATWTGTLATNLATTNSTVATNLDAAITSRMASYTQPTGFLAATFPSAVASTTNITAASGVTLSSAGNTAVATAVEAAILDEGDATALLAAIAAKVEEFLVNEGDATATIAAIAAACNSAIVAGTVGTNVTAIKAKTDNLPAAPASTTNITAGTITTVTNLTNAPTNGDLTATMKASVNTEVDNAIETYHLDHLLAADYDPSSKPGAATALLNELIGNDAGVSQLTANALELGPGGASAAAIAAAMFTADTSETYATSVAGSVVKEIADNAGVGAIENTVVISASAPSLTAINSGGTITIHRGDLTSFQLTDLGSLAGRTGEKIYFTVKAAEYTAASVDDTVATIQVTETTGATRLNGDATTASYGAITVDDATDGDITIALQHQLTTALPIANGYYWDVQLINSAGKPVTLTQGLLNVDADVTRSTT